MDHAKSPEEASIADHNRTTTTPPSPDASTPSRSDSQRDLLARLRSATASLPSFNGSTSQKSLTDALATATAHTHTLLARLRTKLTHLSTQYNTHTGYAAIEGLKTRIDELESSLSSARSLASTAKRTYLIAVQSRSASQRETNDLLSRKSSWSESDLGRYTELLRKEHALSREEAEAEKVLEKSEAQVQASFDELMKAVMVRYHEEQIWSDRMRGMSTYGSLVVAGLNAVLFVVAILLVEPYKRRRLAETFETRLVSAEEQSRELILASVEQFQRSLDALAATRTESEVQPASPPFIPPQVVELREAEEEPVVAVEDVPAPALSQRVARQEEERLVFASTVGVVVGAALSLLISACWT
ncbi:hypothetical protein PSEUBRA_001386 [Kalmanozyma brasiliensis GHG001]|uniref:Sensitive to high expression protein 9, mitochondrial n=1 Tax=Kalmanozyma brasiliensis (strain GHG001) TaxID=1365824 RepID=V5F1A1_KALBG|nr:uncharacterized protein PSEUBRA_001386 [Kalmanozyma brasiliensis GHG001]EST09054.1 hypothetical protein PSEUBRA_001386 [Kalmanozyma brasiliensis GHG001]